MRLRTYGFAVFVALFLAAIPALAHHALQAEFDTTKRGEFTGVLTRFALVNPHVRWFFDVKKADGTVIQWEVSAAGAGPIRQAGLARAFKLGDTYRVTYAPARNGANVGRVVDFYFPDGRKVTLYHENANNPNDL
jgi:Family of unknown function (DUF6152)